MVETLARKICQTWLKNSVIKEEDLDIYRYGCETMVSSIISTSILGVTGILLGKIFETILFFLVFNRLRIHAGGYHATSYRNCITIFNVSCLGILLFTDWLIRTGLNKTYFLWLLIADIVILIFAPIEDLNKPLEKGERKKFGKYARIKVLCFSAGIFTIYYIIPHLRDEMTYAVIAVCEAAILLIIGVIKNNVLISRENGLQNDVDVI